jgi:hypothetical protein
MIAYDPHEYDPRRGPRGHRWHVRYAGRSVGAVYSAPLTRAEVLAIRPGATDAEPILPAHRPATTAEATELRALVHAVLTDPADRDEALRAGLVAAAGTP